MSSFRESINNLIRSDKPESPTDFIFIIGMLSLIALQIYATQKQVQVSHFGEMLTALGLYKTVKVGSAYMKKGAPYEQTQPAAGQDQAVAAIGQQ